MTHYIYDLKEIEDIKFIQYEPITYKQKYLLFVIINRYAYLIATILRNTYDIFTNYGENKMTSKKWFNRMIFLESLAGVPGMVAALSHHLSSMRN